MGDKFEASLPKTIKELTKKNSSDAKVLSKFIYFEKR